MARGKSRLCGGLLPLCVVRGEGTYAIVVDFLLGTGCNEWFRDKDKEEPMVSKCGLVKSGGWKNKNISRDLLK